MLNFLPLMLDMKDMIDSYTFKYGENSCQHSFVSSFCLNGKYGDMFCESGNFLFTLRSKLCSDKECVYLFPHGDFEDVDGIKNALQKIFDDAHEKNCRVKFETLTERAKNVVEKLFPGKFLVESSRDYGEYVYKIEKLINMRGGEFVKKRNNIHKFLREYNGRIRCEKIKPEHISEIKKFQDKWLFEKFFFEQNSAHQELLKHENEEINIALENFELLKLFGIVIFIDDKISAYAVASTLSENCIDEIIQKGNMEIKNISIFLLYDFLKECCEDKNFIYVNREEDLGISGLRRIKEDYQPDFIINKFIMTEC